ncbi:MAG: DNA mismatch repair protein MutS [Myxococcaceae bacterium]|nr:DNA mismatch repair protein MutS [Myxococcaceae bacterium]
MVELPAPVEIANVSADEAPVAAEVPAPALTPMMKQYLEIKAAHPDCMLFFRLGDFYEMFFDDAVKAAELLQITLTARSKGADKVPMAGVPYHAARRYVAKLIGFGLKVAICEQVEEAGGPNIVRREVVRVVTPGMVLDDAVLEASENNFLLGLLPGDSEEATWGAAVLDASTGELLALTPGNLERLAEEVGPWSPKEVVLPEGSDLQRVEAFFSALGRRLPTATLGADAFVPARADAFLRNHFGVASLEGFGLAAAGPSVGAAGACLRYLKETQKNPAQHVDRISLWSRGSALIIDEASRVNLELLRTLKDGARHGSLLGALDFTATSLGARKLSRWLSAPLGDVSAIEARHDAVQELFEKGAFRSELHDNLKGIADIERLASRLSLRSGTPRDLKALGQSLGRLPALAKALGKTKAPLLQILSGPLSTEGVVALGEALERALVDEPPAVVADGGFIAKGFDAQLDALLEISTSGKDYLVKLETRERERTGIGSLKVRYNRVFGYYLEVTKPNLHLVPTDYVRKQTMVGAERFATAELKEYEEKVLTADEKRIALEQKIFETLREQVVSCAAGLRGAAEAVATLDALMSFAEASARHGYSRPDIDESQVLEIEGGRHPVVERTLKGESFVPNDVKLDREAQQLVIITGPNMAGKSTVMRQTALTVIMAQAGCFVPAKYARVGLCDRVFTRVGASDNLAKGQSTFMVEMIETSNILHHATRKSLVVLDEIGRGTSTFDGLSIAWAVAEHLHDRIGARTLFATHYHELTDLARERPKVKNFSVAVKEQGGRVTFLRKLIPGGANRSYGIEVAKLAGLPIEVLGRARELLKNLEAQELDAQGHARLARKEPPGQNEVSAVDASQLGLFGPMAKLPPVAAPQEHPLIDKLRSFEVDQATPLDALNAIAGWKRLLKK